MIKRIIAVFGANAFGQVANIFLRLISVSIFLHFWGKALYGEWLILLTIPSYLALSGTGISTVAANEMAIKNSKGKEEESLGIFQSIWVFVLGISFLFFFVMVVFAVVFPVAQWFQIKQTSPSQIRFSLILLALYTVFLLQGELLVGVYRASGIFAKGIFANNIVSFLENIGVLVIAVLSHGILPAIMVYVFIRIAGTILMARFVLKKALWFHFGFKNARISIVRQSLMPTVSFVCINVSNAFLVQGIITVIGLTLGASAVVGYVVIRTVTNLIKQLNGMIYYSISPEFSTALAVDNKILARKLHRYACQISLLFTLLNIVFLISFGRYILQIWTKGKVEIDYFFFVLMLISLLPNTFYVTSSYVQVAINKLGKIALLSLGTSALFLIVSYAALPSFGIRAIPIIQTIIDSVLLIIIVRDSLKLVQDRIPSFILSMVAIPDIRKLIKSGKITTQTS